MSIIPRTISTLGDHTLSVEILKRSKKPKKMKISSDRQRNQKLHQRSPRRKRQTIQGRTAATRSHNRNHKMKAKSVAKKKRRGRGGSGRDGKGKAGKKKKEA